MTNDAITTKVQAAYQIIESAHKLNLVSPEEYEAALSYKTDFEKTHDIAMLEPLNVKAHDLAQALVNLNQSVQSKQMAQDYLAKANNLEEVAQKYVESARAKSAVVPIPQSVDIFKQKGYVDAGNQSELLDNANRLNSELTGKVSELETKLGSQSYGRNKEYANCERSYVEGESRMKKRLLPLALLAGLGMGVAGYFGHGLYNPCAEVKQPPVVQATPVPTAVATQAPTAEPTKVPVAHKPKSKPKSKPKAKPKVEQKVETPKAPANDDLGGEQELKGL